MLRGDMKLAIRNLKLSLFSYYSFRFKIIFTPRKRVRKVLGLYASCHLMENK